jgi:hypothetical protein
MSVFRSSGAPFAQPFDGDDFGTGGLQSDDRARLLKKDMTRWSRIIHHAGIVPQAE